ncbi:MAG: hypothetical protein ACNA7Y_01160 [Gammaproteobacteria bacterium]
MKTSANDIIKNDIILTQKDLDTSDSAIIKQMQETHYYSPRAQNNSGLTQLGADAGRQLKIMDIYGKPISFPNAKKGNLSEQQVENLLKEGCYPDNIIQLIKKFHSQDPSYIINNTLQAQFVYSSTPTVVPTFTREEKLVWDEKEQAIYFEQTFSDIKLVDKTVEDQHGNPKIIIPEISGYYHIRFKLTPEGFQFNTLTCSNKILADFFLKGMSIDQIKEKQQLQIEFEAVTKKMENSLRKFQAMVSPSKNENTPLKTSAENRASIYKNHIDNIKKSAENFINNTNSENAEKLQNAYTAMQKEPSCSTPHNPKSYAQEKELRKFIGLFVRAVVRVATFSLSESLGIGEWLEKAINQKKHTSQQVLEELGFFVKKRVDPHITLATSDKKIIYSP